ncbi:MAG TPA: nickel pincer cofactor biosynthesis protein LarC [Longimicrobiales bacterium]|nr:nickel pincer cofactor biosynthesis protein LarC [Longimicrobiales bacterium]
MRALVLDPFAGIAGDMFVAALLDLGLEEAWLRDLVATLAIPHVEVRVERVERRGIACPKVTFELPHEHAHRHLPDVLAIVEGSGADGRAKALAADAFRRLAEAEAEVHGVPVERVHFHEVGALDAILDVLCVTSGVVELGVSACYTRPVTLGHGWVHIAHGRFPVPAPATLKLLSGMPVRETNLEGECTTPTGAALLATLTEGRSPPSRLRLVASGYGAGTRDPEDRPNCLRLLLAEVAEAGPDTLRMVQADMDDLAPEYVPAACEAMLAAGALDVTVSAVGMKKGRPGLRLEALVSEALLEPVLEAIFRSTTTIGARHWAVERPALPRGSVEVEWRGQGIRYKRVRLPDGTTRAKPEYEDVARAAAVLGLTPLEVRRALDRAEDAEGRPPRR